MNADIDNANESLIIDRCYTTTTKEHTRRPEQHDLQPKENVATSRGLYLDTCVEIDGKKVGVRVDGQHHFIGKVPTGKSCLRRRHIFFCRGYSIDIYSSLEMDPARRPSKAGRIPS